MSVKMYYKIFAFHPEFCTFGIILTCLVVLGGLVAQVVAVGFPFIGGGLVVTPGTEEGIGLHYSNLL